MLLFNRKCVADDGISVYGSLGNGKFNLKESGSVCVWGAQGVPVGFLGLGGVSWRGVWIWGLVGLVGRQRL